MDISLISGREKRAFRSTFWKKVTPRLAASLPASAIASQTPRGPISRAVVKHEVDRFVAYAGVSRGERGEAAAAVLRSVRLQLLLDRWQPPACLLFSTRAILYAAASSTKNRSTEITSARSLARSRRCIERPRGELLLSRSRKRANAIAPIEGESRRRD